MYRVTPSRAISLSATNSPSQSFPIPNPSNIVDKICHQEVEVLMEEVMEEVMEVMQEAQGAEEQVVGSPTHPHHTGQRIPLIIHRSMY